MTNPEAFLVVDDEPIITQYVGKLLREDGFEVQTASSGEEACDLLKGRRFDVLATDVVMPGISGLKVVTEALKSNPDIIPIVMTGHGSLETALDALALGAYSYLTKPFDPATFRNCVQRGVEKQRLTKELKARNQELEALNRDLDRKVQEATRQLRELNHRILTEMASLKEVDDLKTAFLDNVSHDMKNPITTIRGYASMLLDDSDPHPPEELPMAMKAVVRVCGHMEYLIGQLLHAAQLAHGKIKLDLKRHNIPELLEEARQMVRPQADSGGLTLETRCEPGLPPEVPADRGRLMQVFLNLLGNAIKFTPKGGRVTLRAARGGAPLTSRGTAVLGDVPEGVSAASPTTPGAESGASARTLAPRSGGTSVPRSGAGPVDSAVRFSVEDTGRGIPKEHLDRIFERFYQVDEGRAREFKGLGLGLQIAKDLVALHKGRLWVESEAGQGSKFHFTIPL